MRFAVFVFFILLVGSIVYLRSLGLDASQRVALEKRRLAAGLTQRPT